MISKRKVIISLAFLFYATFGMASSSIIDFRNDFRQSSGIPSAEYLDVSDIAVRTELLLEGIFNKTGDGWYTTPAGVNNYLGCYNSANKSLYNQNWKRQMGTNTFFRCCFQTYRMV